MAEGYEFENPTFNEDYYDGIDDKLPMVPNETDQRIILNQSGTIDDLRGELRKSAVEAQKKRLVKTFYDKIENERYKMAPGKIDYDQVKISDDGKTLFWIVGDTETRITAKQGRVEFLSLGTLANQYNRVAGRGGTLAVRQYLNLPDYRSNTQLSQQVRQALESTRNDMPDLEVSGTELHDLINTVIETETAVKSLETSLTDWVHTDTQTEGLTLREPQGLDKALQRTRVELTNNLSKLTELDKDITIQKQK